MAGDGHAEVRVLGTAQDGGVPHAGCSCATCAAAREDPALRRCVASIALVGACGRTLVVDVTPDFPEQAASLAEALGRELARRFEPVLADCAAVVPVPLHWTRALRRGYNQAELIAKEFADSPTRPLARGLTRRSATRHQTGLSRERRRANLSQAFRWRGKTLRRERPHCLLVDDVLTTGATLDSAARTLKRAGIGRVTALVVAITPHPEELGTRNQHHDSHLRPPGG